MSLLTPEIRHTLTLANFRAASHP